MKKLQVLIICIFISITSYKQIIVVAQPLTEQDISRLNSIEVLYTSNKYIDAIEQLNELITRYPLLPELHVAKAFGQISLNDYYGARKELKIAEKWGTLKDLDGIDVLLSTKRMAESILKDTKYDYILDSLRGYKPVINPKDIIRGALRDERTCFDVFFYDLTVKIFPETKSIEGSNTIFFTAVTNTKKIQIDLFPEYSITSIMWNNKNLTYTRDCGAIYIDFGEEIKSGSREKITIEYKGIPKIAPRPPWNGGFVWEKEKGRYSIGVVCEHLGASSWWPNKDHLSDKTDSIRINVQVPKGYQAISNGNLRSQREMDNEYTNFEWFVSYPINNYSVTFYMGDFVNFNEKFTNQNGSYQIDYYVLPKNLEKAKKYYANTKDVISALEKGFGEYPFKDDGVGMVESPYEGMEHQGAIAIGGEYGKGNNKREYWTKEYDYLVIHETAHEWWGNAVSMGDMADAWISEGFTTYTEYLFAEEKFGYPEYIRALASNNKQILNIWPMVGEKGINDNTFLGGDIYNKGAAMLNNLRCIINNDSLFRRIIKDYYSKYKYRTTTTADFVNHVKEYTKTDLNDFFDVFLFGTDPPVLQVYYKIVNGSTLNFTYWWKNTGKGFTMPFCIVLNNKEYIRLIGTTEMQTFVKDKVKTFFLANEYNYDKNLVPQNSFTYYWTSWPF